MCQPTVDPKVKLCVWVTKKKTDKSVPGGEEDQRVTAEISNQTRNTQKETSNSSICTTETDIERSLLFFGRPLFLLFSSPWPLLILCYPSKTRAPLFTGGRRRRRHSRRRALLSHYLITAAASKEESTFGSVTFGESRDIHGGAGVFDRGSRLSSANGKVAAGGAGAESRVRIRTSAKLSAQVASLQTQCAAF